MDFKFNIFIYMCVYIFADDFLDVIDRAVKIGVQKVTVALNVFQCVPFYCLNCQFFLADLLLTQFMPPKAY